MKGLPKEVQLRIAIGKVCGYKEFQSPHNRQQKIWALNEKQASTLPLISWVWDLIPDYLNDLNAMHEAEKVLRYSYKDPWGGAMWSDSRFDYDRQLQRILERDRKHDCLQFNWEATAAQRAEAFCSTLHLLEETPTL